MKRDTDDLSDIEFMDIYELIKIREQNNRECPEIKKIHRSPIRMILQDFENLVSSRIKLDPTKKTVMISDGRFGRVAEILREKYNVIVLSGSVKYSWKLIKEKKRVYSQNKEAFWVKEGFLKNDVKYARRAVRIFMDYLIKNHVDLVILGNDRTFMERIMIFAARKAGIQKVVIQHAIFSNGADKDKYADYLWVWSDYFKDMVKDYFYNSEKRLRVIGYPFFVHKLEKKRNGAVLFFGSDFREVITEFSAPYLELIEVVYEICIKHGYTMRYRPHPGENPSDIKALSKNDNPIEISNGISIFEDISDSNVLVGLYTTASLEAALGGREFIEITLYPTEIKDNIYRDYTYKIPNDADVIEQYIVDGVEDRLPAKRVNPYYAEDDEKKLRMTLFEEIDRIVK